MEYPANALTVQFTTLSGKSHKYQIWFSQNRWLWHAAGNSGVEDTQELAMAAARRWITTLSQVH
jgi:hypothetical protein